MELWTRMLYAFPSVGVTFSVRLGPDCRRQLQVWGRGGVGAAEVCTAVRGHRGCQQGLHRVCNKEKNSNNAGLKLQWIRISILWLPRRESSTEFKQLQWSY